MTKTKRKPQAPVRSTRLVRRTWTVDAPSVTDRVVLALSRAYGYRGTSADTAANVLERKGYQLIPW